MFYKIILFRMLGTGSMNLDDYNLQLSVYNNVCDTHTHRRETNIYPSL